MKVKSGYVKVITDFHDVTNPLLTYDAAGCHRFGHRSKKIIDL